MKHTSIFAIALAFLALTFGSCMSLHQKLTFKAIPSDLPVSASSSILVGDKVVQLDEFESSVPFSLQKEIKIPLKTPDAVVDLYPDLKAAVDKSGGNAIAGLKISIKDFSSSDYYWAGFERYMGAYFAIIGGALAIEISAMSTGTYASGSDNFVLPCAIIGGAGAVLFGASFLHERLGNSVYTIGLEGQSVKISRPLQ
jgi:hypothetical protein